MSRPPDVALIGRVIAGKYEISEYIGGGGMGAVYRAHQKSIDKDVALKVMHPEMAHDPKFAERFQREARAASRLDHVNSMRVMDFGQEPDGILYIVMELLEGKNLLDVVRDEPMLSDERIVGILSQVLAALAVAHGMGIVHRDLKPENVMILAGRSDDGDAIDLVKVCDFGIAKIADPRSDDKAERAKEKLTSQGKMIVTPEYMSPEQARGDPLDSRSDLYSVGVILFQLITGRIPFEGETALGIALKHVTDEVPKPSLLNANVNPLLEAVCLKAMQKRRDDRYATARDMRADLRNALLAASRRAGQEARIVETLPAGTPAIDPVLSQRARIGVAETMLTPNDAGGIPSVRHEVVASKGTVAGTSSVIVGAATGESARSSSRLPWALAILAVLGAGGVFLAMRIPKTPTGKGETLTTNASSTLTGSVEASDSAPSPVPPQPSTIAVPSIVPSTTASTITTIVATLRPTPTFVPVPPTTSKTSETASIAAPIASTAPPIETAPPPTATTTAPPPPATTTATAPKPPPTAAPPTPVDLASASVGIGAISTTNGVTGTQMRKALAPLPFLKCYRDALKIKGSAASGNATMFLSIDDTGHVTAATLKGADFLPSMRGCIEGVGRMAKVEVDTGEASATVTLAFSSK